MTQFVPLKDAINLFEQHRDNNSILSTEDPFRSTDSQGDSFLIIQPPKVNHLISYVAKEVHSTVSGLSYHIKGLQLYGKKYEKENILPYDDREYEKVYIEIIGVPFDDPMTGYVIGDNYNYHLFEDYNYQDLYDIATNYTVLGNKKKGVINFTHISVKLEDLIKLINTHFSKSSDSEIPEYQRY